MIRFGTLGGKSFGIEREDSFSEIVSLFVAENDQHGAVRHLNIARKVVIAAALTDKLAVLCLLILKALEIV